jgi:YesN/AraC family two-component response regulator
MLIVKEVVSELGYDAPYYFFRIFQKTLAPRRWPTGGR